MTIRAINWAKLLSFFIGAVFLAGGLWILAHTLCLIASTHTAMLQFDEWDVLNEYRHLVDGTTSLLDYFWQQHNEHRVAIARLVFITDFLFFGGRQIFSVTFMLVFWACIFALFAILIWRACKLPLAWRVAVLGALIAIFFNDTQMENFIRGFNNQVFTVVGFAAFSVFFMIRAASYDKTGQSKKTTLVLGASLLCGLCSTYSMACGLAIWPVLFVLALGLRLSRRWIIVILLAGIAAVASYLFHYARPGGAPDPLQSMVKLVQLSRYMLVFFGGPVGPFRILWAGIFGTVMLLLLIYQAYRRFNNQASICATDWFLLGTAAYAICAGVMVSLGRSDFGIDFALSTRYSTFVVPLWAAVLGLCVTLPNRAASPEQHPGRTLFMLDRAALALLLLACCALLFVQKASSGWSRGQYAGYENAATAIIARAPDKPALMFALLLPDVLLDGANYLADTRRSLFADNASYTLYRLIGAARHHPLTGYAATDGDWCKGHIDAAAPIVTLDPAKDGAWSILNGWAVDMTSRNPVDGVIFTDQAGRIVGIGRMTAPRHDIARALKLPDRDRLLHVTGYADVDSTQPLTAYALSAAHGSVCRLQ